MRMTDAELRDAYVHATRERKEQLRKELRLRARWAIIRALPNPEGTCGHGLRVYADQRGAYSSGYICHAGPGGGICNKGRGLDVKWDIQPRREQLLALLDDLGKPPAIA